MRAEETLFHHHLKGSVEANIWAAHEGAIEVKARAPGFREWWRLNTYPFTTDFSAYVDRKLDEAEKSGVEYQWFGSAELPDR